MRYRIYSDGSTRGNGRKDAVGAWAYVIVDDNDNILAEGYESEVGTTNQRMELIGALMGLEYAFKEIKMGDYICLYTDSAYLHNCQTQRWYANWIANGWKNTKKQPVANADVWERLVPYFEAWGISFNKVKGHAGDKWNEYVDTLAQTAAEKRKEEVKNANSNN